MRSTTTVNRGLVWILVLLAFGSLASLQALYDQSAAPTAKQLKQAVLSLKDPLVPSVKALKALSLGQQSAVADLLWLKTIQYFGSSSPYGKYPALGPLLDTITQVDPKFEYAYEFGLVALPFMDNADMAVTLGERAQTALPGNGLLTYYLATVYHLNLKDYAKAHYYYEKASHEPGSPASAELLAGVTLNNVRNTLSDRLVAISFWQTVYNNAKSQEEKDRAAAWITHMELIYNLESAAQQFKDKNGRFPNSFQELKDAGFITTIPTTSLGRLLVLDPKTGVVHFDELAPTGP